MVRKAAITALLAAAMAFQLSAVSAETLTRVQTAVAPQGSVHGAALLNGILYVSETDTGLIKAIDTTDQKEMTMISQPLQEPKGLAVSADGTLYVAESGKHRIVKISPKGEMKVIAGNGEPGFKDGAATQAQFHSPSDVKLAADGSLFVADTLNHRVRKIATDGTVTTVAGSSVQKDADGWLIGGLKDGQAAESLLNEPTGLAINKQGLLYIADTGNQRIRAVTPEGMVQTIAGGGDERVEDRYRKGGFADGKGAAARFFSPIGLALSAEGNLYVADALNNAVRMVAPDGTVSTLAGGEHDGVLDGWGVDAQLDNPIHIAVDAHGTLWVTDRWNRTVRVLSNVQIPDPSDAGQIRIVFDGKPIVLHAQPLILNGSTYVPIRDVAEALHYQVTFDEVTRNVTLTNKSGSKLLSQQKTKVVGGRTMVPVRELGALLDVMVSWSPTYRLVDLTSMPK